MGLQRLRRQRLSLRLRRIDAKQYLQWITHGTLEKRRVQSQMLFGYRQFNDFGQCLESSGGQGVEVVRKGLVHVTHRNGLAVPSPDVSLIALTDTGKIVSSWWVEVDRFLQRTDIGQRGVRYRENETAAWSEARTYCPKYRRHVGAAQVADHEYGDHPVELLPREILKPRGIAALETHGTRCSLRDSLPCTPDHFAGDVDAEYRRRTCLRRQAGNIALSAPQIQHMLACQRLKFLQHQRSGGEIREDHGLLPGPLVSVLVEHSSKRVSRILWPHFRTSPGI